MSESTKETDVKLKLRFPPLPTKTLKWFYESQGLSGHFDEPQDKSRFICGCSDDSTYDILNMKREDIPKQFRDIIDLLPDADGELLSFENLQKDGRDLVEWCVDFLITRETPNKQPMSPSLWEFITDFLEIEKDSGYDYLLLNCLDWYRITEHGAGIRCSWLNTDNKLYSGRVVSEERHRALTNFILKRTAQ